MLESLPTIFSIQSIHERKKRIVNNERLKKCPPLWAFFVALLFFSDVVNAGQIHVAVASNFKHALQRLVVDFEAASGHKIIISSASSGKLYAQIKHGAPYDLFLSADEARADQLIADKLAVADSASIYALGKLVFVSNSGSRGECKQRLSSPQLRRLAIANPEIAPYGLAAKQVLENLELLHPLSERMVLGENVLQAYQFVATKNAEAGFVSESILKMDRQNEYACIWYVPTDLYSPIKQKMVLLKKAKKNQPAGDFMRYLKSVKAKKIIETAGYNVP